MVPDWEMIQQRFLAFWAGEIVDRPIVITAAAKPGAVMPAAIPSEEMAGLVLNVQVQLDRFEAAVAATHYAGDSFPCYCPYFAAGGLAAFLGSEVNFATDTAWLEPCVASLRDDPLPPLNRESRYFRGVVALTEAAVARSQERYLVGITDIGGVTDVLAALRGTQGLLLEMADAPEAVDRWMRHITGCWLETYETLAALLPAEWGVRAWLPFWTPKRSYVLQDDFSCMVSAAHFRRFCLPAIATLSEAMDHAFYHLDGPDAARHLDALLELPGIRGIQWQPGSGGGWATEWLPLLKRIQAAGRGMVIDVRPEEFDTIMQELRPGGVIVRVAATDPTPEEAEGFVRYLARWR